MTFCLRLYIIGSMKIKINEITQLFAPTFSFTKADKHLRMYGAVDFNNDALYAKTAE